MDQAEEAALEAAWQFLWREQGDVSFAEILKFARVRAPCLSKERVWAEFDRRLRARCGLAERPAEALEGTGATSRNNRTNGRPRVQRGPSSEDIARRALG